jgi:hypothetical protein
VTGAASNVSGAVWQKSSQLDRKPSGTRTPPPRGSRAHSRDSAGSRLIDPMSTSHRIGTRTRPQSGSMVRRTAGAAGPVQAYRGTARRTAGSVGSIRQVATTWATSRVRAATS